MALSWGKRIQLYLFGLILGLVVVYFFVLKDKNIYKTPQEIIFERLKSYSIIDSEISLCKFNCIGRDHKELGILLETAEINYSESDVRKKPFPVYKIYGKNQGSAIQFFRAEMRDTNFVIIDLGLVAEKDTCACK